MDPFRKAYCRVFQAVLRLAIPFLPYRRPEIVDSVAKVPAAVRGPGRAGVLIVTDPGVAALGLTGQLEKALRLASIPFTVFDQVEANPTTDTIEAASALYRQKRCQAIIAMGGGSSIDCGKAVGIRIVKPDKPLRKCRGILKVRAKLPQLIAIPTTAGTGSETTLAAVITDSQTRHKFTINDFPLIPQCAVLDPEMTHSLPPFLTATTGMDALTHAVEAYIGRSTTPDTRADALEAVRLIFANIDRAYTDGEDRTARRNMLHAAFRAGCAFTKSYVGYVHAVAHSLGGEYNVPHGYANAVILPMVLDYYGSAVHQQLKDLAVAVGLAGEDTPLAEAARTFIDAIKDMKRRFSIGNTIPELKREDINKLSRYADKEANPLYPVPVLLGAGELRRFYKMLLEEDEL